MISGISVCLANLHPFVVVPTAFFNVGRQFSSWVLKPHSVFREQSCLLGAHFINSFFPKIDFAFYQILCLFCFELISLVQEWTNCAQAVHLWEVTLMLPYFFWEHLTSCISECFSFFHVCSTLVVHGEHPNSSFPLWRPKECHYSLAEKSNYFISTWPCALYVWSFP